MKKIIKMLTFLTVTFISFSIFNVNIKALDVPAQITYTHNHPNRLTKSTYIDWLSFIQTAYKNVSDFYNNKVPANLKDGRYKYYFCSQSYNGVDRRLNCYFSNNEKMANFGVRQGDIIGNIVVDYDYYYKIKEGKIYEGEFDSTVSDVTFKPLENSNGSYDNDYRSKHAIYTNLPAIYTNTDLKFYDNEKIWKNGDVFLTINDSVIKLQDKRSNCRAELCDTKELSIIDLESLYNNPIVKYRYYTKTNKKSDVFFSANTYEWGYRPDEIKIRLINQITMSQYWLASNTGERTFDKTYYTTHWSSQYLDSNFSLYTSYYEVDIDLTNLVLAYKNGEDYHYRYLYLYYNGDIIIDSSTYNNGVNNNELLPIIPKEDGSFTPPDREPSKPMNWWDYLNPVTWFNYATKWLVGLIIPDMSFFTGYFNKMYDFFKEKLGILLYPFDFILDILNRFMTLEKGSCIINIPDFNIPYVGTILKKQSFNLCETWNSSGVNELYILYRSFVYFFVSYCLVNLSLKKYNKIVSGGNSNVN